MATSRNTRQNSKEFPLKNGYFQRIEQRRCCRIIIGKKEVAPGIEEAQGHHPRGSFRAPENVRGDAHVPVQKEVRRRHENPRNSDVSLDYLTSAR